jgi:hypothetical protein
LFAARNAGRRDAPRVDVLSQPRLLLEAPGRQHARPGGVCDRVAAPPAQDVGEGDNAQGATAQVGAFVYSVAGANNAAHETHLAGFIAGFALALGLGFGIGLYRIRRGMPSSLKPPKANGKKATRASASKSTMQL